MAEFSSASDQAISQRRNPLQFAADTYLATARARSAQPGSGWDEALVRLVADAVGRYVTIVGEAHERLWAATDIMRPAALMRDTLANGAEARARLEALDGPGSAAAKLTSELNTLVASVRPTRRRFHVLGDLAAALPDPELDARLREIRQADAGRKVEAVRAAILVDVKRKDDERYLAHVINPVTDVRDHVLDEATRARLDEAFVERAGKAARRAALKEAAGMLADVRRLALQAVAAFAGPAPEAEPESESADRRTLLRVADDGSLAPIA